MTKAIALALVACAPFSFTWSAEARSCTDELNACMKIYNVTRGKQGPVDLIATCRNDFNGCMQTGTWAGRTVTRKGLEKK